MTSRDLLSLAAEITKATDPDSPLGLLLQGTAVEFIAALDSTRKLIPTSAGSNNDHAQIFGQLVTQVANAGVDTRRVNLLKIFYEIKEVKEVVTRFLKTPDLAGINDLRHTATLIDKFTTDLENYWRNHKIEDAYVLIVTGARLESELRTLRTSASIIQASLTPPAPEKTADEESLSLYLPGENDLAAFGRKLSAVASLYGEFCELLEVSTAKYPLRIVKVESGTTWIDVVGNAHVIQFVILAISNGAYYLYRNYSREGGLAQIPKAADAIERLLRIDDEMSKRGLDVTKLRERIVKVSIKVAENLDTLLKGEEEVQINGASHPTTPERQQQLIAGKAILKLEENTSGYAVPPNRPTDPAQNPPA